jgi:hypothetical protein
MRFLSGEKTGRPMKIIFDFFLVMALFHGGNLSVFAQNSVPKIERGGLVAELSNRAKLRTYVAKLGDAEQTLTTEELIDYIKKGGSIDSMNRYDVWKDFNLGRQETHLGDYFIYFPQASKTEALKKDQSLLNLRIILKAGAKVQPLVRTAIRSNYAPNIDALLEFGPIDWSQVHFDRVETIEFAEYLFAKGLRPFLNSTDREKNDFLRVAFGGGNRNLVVAHWMLDKKEIQMQVALSAKENLEEHEAYFKNNNPLPTWKDQTETEAKQLKLDWEIRTNLYNKIKTLLARKPL